MSSKGTPSSIVDAAEELFAEQGFAETTVRQITSRANVNLAAINYHFGSKKGLIQAVAEKFITPLINELSNQMDCYVDTDVKPALDDLLEILMRALLIVRSENKNTLPVFMRLLELAYMNNQEELRDFLIGRYKSRLEHFLRCIREDSAPMEDDEFFWRLHFMLGSMTFTLSNFKTLHSLEKHRFTAKQDETEVEQILHRMIPVLSAGMQARGEKLYFSKV